MFVYIFAVLVVVSGGAYGIPLESQAKSLDSRIHGGVDAPPGHAPHMVALFTGDRWILMVCGGSIISRRHVLTAAHCVTPFVMADNQLTPTFQGRVGSNIWHSGGTVIYFQEHFIHPQWDANTIKHDVAVLTMTKCLKLNAQVAIIGLSLGQVGGGEKAYVTGWGTTLPKIDDNMVQLAPTPDYLQLLNNLSTLSHEECVKRMQSSPSWEAIAPPIIAELEICAFHSVGHGMCHGDSGSALVLKDSGQMAGIVSWGMPCAVGAPDVYTRITAVLEFISKILRKSSSSCHD